MASVPTYGSSEMENFIRYILWIIGIAFFVVSSFFGTITTALQDDIDNSAAPVYRCDTLVVRPTENTSEFEFVTRFTATNGAYLSSIAYDFGDGDQMEPMSPAENAPRHNYDKPGTYTATAALTFNVTADDKSTSTCSAEVVVD